MTMTIRNSLSVFHSVTAKDTLASPGSVTFVTEPAEIIFRSDVTVELVRASANDSDVLFAARVSTLGEQTLEAAVSGAEATARDRGLINYLMRDRHGSPFEHTAMTFYVQAPIFVFREFMRHRIASYNEESARYRELLPVFYVPGPDRTWCRWASLVRTTFCPEPLSKPLSSTARCGASVPPPMPPISGCSTPALLAKLLAWCCP
jgi:thymidylate synthase ThyX